MKISVLCLTAFAISVVASAAAIDVKTLDALAQKATSGDASQADEAIAGLRTAGPEGLDAMFRVYADRLNEQQKKPVDNADWERLREAFDTVGQQRDCYASHLYWYTNFDEAKVAARASGKPILSLRLLGKLNEEYSCANSRFFRTTLYSNAQVSQYLREHFILHWQSVRPVPRITIDMGDGRRIERTITGNSIHYILDADGNPIDALPGLYSAKTFLTELDRAATAEQQASKLSGRERDSFLVSYHSARLHEIQRELSNDLARIGMVSTIPVTEPAASATPDAIDAATRAGTKMRVEAPMLRAGAEMALPSGRGGLEALNMDSVWKQIAVLHSGDAKLDANAEKLVAFKQPPTAQEAARMAFSKSIVENPMVRMLRNLENSIAEDTVRNEYQLHARIHEWFVNGTAPTNLNALNSKVYAELFLTPNSDAWLGLAPADTFSALDGGGLVKTR